MKIFVPLAVFASAASLAFAQIPAAQPGWPTVFVDADNGFNFYLTAAIAAKHAPLVVVTDKSIAEYSLEGVADAQHRLGIYDSIIYDWTAPFLPQNVHSTNEASVRLVNLQTNEVVFAFSVDRNNAWHGTKSIAEACAKHLKIALRNNTAALAGGGSTGGQSAPGKTAGKTVVKAARAVGILPSHDPTFAF